VSEATHMSPVGERRPWACAGRITEAKVARSRVAGVGREGKEGKSSPSTDSSASLDWEASLGESEGGKRQRTVQVVGTWAVGPRLPGLATGTDS